MDTLLMQNQNKAELFVQVNNAVRYFTDAYYEPNDQSGSITEGKSSIDMKLVLSYYQNVVKMSISFETRIKDKIL